MNRKFLWMAMAILLLVVIVALVYVVVNPRTQGFNGSIINPPFPADDFSLTSQTQQTIHLSDYRGKYVLLFFGFTNCTEECPLTMGYLKQVHDRLKDQADKIQVIMITTDPARDDPSALGAFLAHFDPSFIGLTGLKSDLQTVWTDYGVTVLDNGETHSSFVYLIDTQGNLIMTYPILQNADGITADLQRLMRGK